MKFLMNNDWMFDGIIDSEQKEYVLLSFFQKINKPLEELKLYPTFTELSFHLANIQNLLREDKLLYLRKKLKNLDDEISYKNIGLKTIPTLTESEKSEYKKILDTSYDRLQFYFNIIKSIWIEAYTSVDIELITKKQKKINQGFFYVRKDDDIRVWKYHVYRKKDEIFSVIDEVDGVTFDKNLPVFELKTDVRFPMEETMIPLIKRKVISFVMQTKNLTIS